MTRNCIAITLSYVLPSYHHNTALLVKQQVFKTRRKVFISLMNPTSFHLKYYSRNYSGTCNIIHTRGITLISDGSNCGRRCSDIRWRMYCVVCCYFLTSTSILMSLSFSCNNARMPSSTTLSMVILRVIIFSTFSAPLLSASMTFWKSLMV